MVHFVAKCPVNVALNLAKFCSILINSWLSYEQYSINHLTLSILELMRNNNPLSFHGETIYEYCTWKVGMSIGCYGKLGHLFGFLQHYLLMW